MASSSSATTTLLRVKRRRTDPPLGPTLRIPTRKRIRKLDPNDLSSLLTSASISHEATTATTTRLNNVAEGCSTLYNNNNNTSSAAASTGNFLSNEAKYRNESAECVHNFRPKNIKFKRIAESSEKESEDLFRQLPMNDGLKKKRNFRVVDCLREEEEERMNKKAKISLRMVDIDFQEKVEEEGEEKKEGSASSRVAKKKEEIPSGKKKRGKAIMDPLTSMVDNHLRQYHESGPSLINSYFDCLLGHWEKINHICSNGMGTILHGAALWNDLFTTRKVLEMGIDVKLIDGEGRRAVSVAKLSGNMEIESLIREKMEEEDFVYDLYCLDEEEEGGEEACRGGKRVKKNVEEKVVQSDDLEKDETSSTTTENGDDDDLSVEIRNGFGYWNEHGELVLEMDPEFGSDECSSTKMDDDVDSNDENYEGNSYPDDESSENDEEQEYFIDRKSGFLGEQTYPFLDENDYFGD